MTIFNFKLASVLFTLVLTLSQCATTCAQISHNTNTGVVSISTCVSATVTRTGSTIHIQANCLFPGTTSLSTSNVTELSIGGVNSNGLDVMIMAHINGDINISGGSNDDTIHFVGGGASGEVTIDTFGGDDQVLIDEPIQTSDIIATTNFFGIVRIDTGNGRDRVLIDGNFIDFNNWLLIDSGRGADNVELVDCFCEILSIDTGYHNDRCRLEGIYVGAQTFLSLSRGNDALTIFRSEFDGSAFFNGSSGTDSLLRFLNEFSGINTFTSF